MNYKHHYDQLVERARLRGKPEGYSERHHIIPRCLGGSDEPVNLVHLTAREHYVAHQLLVKMNPGHRKLAFAALTMTVTPHGHRQNNRTYAWVKKRFADSQRGAANVVHREDVKAKLRVPKSEAHKEKLRRPKSEAQKTKQREIMTGRKMSDDFKAKVSAYMSTSHPMKGRVQSAEARKMISEANKVKVACAVCGHVNSKSVISRFHNEKCKKGQS